MFYSSIGVVIIISIVLNTIHEVGSEIFTMVRVDNGQTISVTWAPRYRKPYEVYTFHYRPYSHEAYPMGTIQTRREEATFMYQCGPNTMLTLVLNVLDTRGGGVTYVGTEVLQHPCVPFYANFQFIAFLLITLLAIVLSSALLYIKCKPTPKQPRPRIPTPIIPSEPVPTPSPYRHILQQLGLPEPEEPITITTPPVPAELSNYIPCQWDPIDWEMAYYDVPGPPLVVPQHSSNCLQDTVLMDTFNDSESELMSTTPTRRNTVFRRPEDTNIYTPMNRVIQSAPDLSSLYENIQ